MTTRLAPETYLQFWQEAEGMEIGLFVTCHPDDQVQLLNSLYECRQTFGGFEEMMICQPKPPGTIYILHKNAELP